MMKIYNIAVLVMLLALDGCEDQTSGGKSSVSKQLNETSTEQHLDWDELSDSLPPELLAELQKKADAGDAVAQQELGFYYDSQKDAVKAFEWTKKAAAQGGAVAQSRFGVMYALGEGTQKDDVKAVEWYQKAAEQGDVIAQTNLAYKYYSGEGIPKDVVKAFEWFQKAAAQGGAGAQFYIGLMYSNGEGVPKDAVRAFEWFQKAAEQGGAVAQYRIGFMYYNGIGVHEDNLQAFEWFQKAAVQGDASSQFKLGNMYSNGEGVPKDAIKAVEWFQKAAEQGGAAAQNNLGYRYAHGEGVPKDEVRAYAWFNLAAAQGIAAAQSNRDLCEQKLSAAERMEGQRLASSWKKGDTLLVTSSNHFAKYDKVPPNNKPHKQSTGADQWAELDNYTPKESKLSKQQTGTAFAVSNEGHALTNHHVINGCTEVKVAGREGAAKVITSDSVNDLALLQLPGKSDAFAKLNPDPDKLRQGEDVIVFGYPLNFALSSGGNLTPGTLSALTGLGNNTNQNQITAPIQPGSSGSPVMDKKGNVMAVVSMTLDDGKMTKITGQVGQNVNFAVNGQTVKLFLDANKVPYKTGGGFFSTEKSNADIADEAKKWTVLVECWK
jgi:TPR repeat protein